VVDKGSGSGTPSTGIEELATKEVNSGPIVIFNLKLTKPPPTEFRSEKRKLLIVLSLAKTRD